MFNRRIKIIAVLCFIVLLLLIIFTIKIFKGKNDVKNESEITEVSGVDRSGLSETKLGVSREPVKNASTTVLEIIKPCSGRQDEKDCIASIALAQGRISLCHLLEKDLEREAGERLVLRCQKDILLKTADTEVGRCQSLQGDDFYNCLRGTFSIFKEQADCANLPEEDTRLICADVFSFENAYARYDRQSCQKIKNSKLNLYCLENIISKSQDSDKDGLTDLDEINVYDTDPDNPDTDKDGHKDGDEVKSGFNPNGAGKI